ncbi:DUF2165 domain-containing protein [Streptomyces sp. ICBB 8177]|uniref:DUF2165 domain-containing protein n=1 Tax=Streptomyces sp. ICBB 8177 TaxID=563922 RepID=UPI0023B0F614|nr:DUF2165 domain-containing protein [Streptomyces sp. ICBB 8177]
MLGAVGTARAAATALTATVGVYMALVAFGNITDFGTNRAYVRHVFAMDTTFHDKALMWRAITSPGLADAGYVAIIAWETLTALVLIAATVWWCGAARPERALRARRAAVLGLVMTELLFGAGFIAIGGEWFAMWQSKQWNGLDSAIRDFTPAGVALLAVLLTGGEREGALPRE